MYKYHHCFANNYSNLDLLQVALLLFVAKDLVKELVRALVKELVKELVKLSVSAVAGK